MRPIRGCVLAIMLAAGVGATAQPARAGVMTYLALGDSLAFGETTFTQNPSNGERGYVEDIANNIASMNGGARPAVVNLGIDGETSSSFLTGTGRVISVPGMTDQQLAAWNTNYTNPATSQNSMLQQEIASAASNGHPVGLVTISLGANDLFQLAANSTFQSATPAVQQQMLEQTLNKIGSTYAVILAELHSLAPGAKVLAVGEYNPFPANPSNPLNTFAATAIQGLNQTIQAVAGQWGATYVDTYTPFIGHEAQYSYLSATSDNVHPNATGYSVIASQIEAAMIVPEPSTIAVFAVGFAGLLVAARRRVRAA